MIKTKTKFIRKLSIVLKGRNICVVNMLTAICLASSLILLLGPLVVAGCSSGHLACCFFAFPPPTLFFFPSLLCFFLVPGNPDSPVFFKSRVVFFSAAGLSDTPGLGYLASCGSIDSFGSDLLAFLLGGFSSFDVGSLVALRVLVFGSDGLHSLSSSLLAVWEKDLTGENVFEIIFSNNVDFDANCTARVT